MYPNINHAKDYFYCISIFLTMLYYEENFQSLKLPDDFLPTIQYLLKKLDTNDFLSLILQWKNHFLPNTPLSDVIPTLALAINTPPVINQMKEKTRLNLLINADEISEEFKQHQRIEKMMYVHYTINTSGDKNKLLDLKTALSKIIYASNISDQNKCLQHFVKAHKILNTENPEQTAIRSDLVLIIYDIALEWDNIYKALIHFNNPKNHLSTAEKNKLLSIYYSRKIDPFLPDTYNLPHLLNSIKYDNDNRWDLKIEAKKLLAKFIKDKDAICALVCNQPHTFNPEELCSQLQLIYACLDKKALGSFFWEQRSFFSECSIKSGNLNILCKKALAIIYQFGNEINDEEKTCIMSIVTLIKSYGKLKDIGADSIYIEKISHIEKDLGEKMNPKNPTFSAIRNEGL